MYVLTTCLACQHIYSNFLFNVGFKRIQVFRDVQLCHCETIQ